MIERRLLRATRHGVTRFINVHKNATCKISLRLFAHVPKFLGCFFGLWRKHITGLHPRRANKCAEMCITECPTSIKCQHPPLICGVFLVPYVVSGRDLDSDETARKTNRQETIGKVQHIGNGFRFLLIASLKCDESYKCSLTEKICKKS